jgi:hypothetical protein
MQRNDSECVGHDYVVLRTLVRVMFCACVRILVLGRVILYELIIAISYAIYSKA